MLDIKYYKSIDEENFGSIKGVFEDQVIGTLTYKLKRNTAWLYKVEVAKEFREQGIGSTLLNIFEDECAKARVDYIEGKYFPEGESGDKVKSFYTSHGYSIYKEDYETFVGKNNPQAQNTPQITVISDTTPEL